MGVLLSEIAAKLPDGEVECSTKLDIAIADYGLNGTTNQMTNTVYFGTVTENFSHP